MVPDFRSFDVVMEIQVDNAVNQPQCYNSRNICMGNLKFRLES